MGKKKKGKIGQKSRDLALQTAKSVAKTLCGPGRMRITNSSVVKCWTDDGLGRVCTVSLRVRHNKTTKHFVLRDLLIVRFSPDEPWEVAAESRAVARLKGQEVYSLYVSNTGREYRLTCGAGFKHNLINGRL